MKRLDKRLERKLSWLILPLAIIATVFFIDVLFDLNMQTIEWITPALLIGAMIPFVGFSIAYIKHKCWGMLTIALILIIFMLINMSNYFINLIAI